MLTMFKEKDTGDRPVWSMTRVVAFLAAMTLNYAIVVMSRKDHVHDIAWPFCVMYVVTLLAVPLQMMFKLLQAWFTSNPGKQLLKTVLQGVQVKASEIALHSTPGATTVKTEVTQGGDVTGA